MIKTLSGNKLVYLLKYSSRYILLKLSNVVHFLRSDVKLFQSTLHDKTKDRLKYSVRALGIKSNVLSKLCLVTLVCTSCTYLKTLKMQSKRKSTEK